MRVANVDQDIISTLYIREYFNQLCIILYRNSGKQMHVYTLLGSIITRN